MNNDHYIADKPLEEGLVLFRGKGGEACTNVKQYIERHSPDGFEWGYGGSGASELALNLVNQILNHMNYKGLATQFDTGSAFILTVTLYQNFKNKFITSANRDGDFIPYDEMHSWVEEQMELQPA